MRVYALEVDGDVVGIYTTYDLAVKAYQESCYQQYKLTSEIETYTLDAPAV